MIEATDTYWHMQPHRKLALQLAKRDVPVLVFDAVNLEGVAMTLPEVQTLLDGITVGGHRISDQHMALNQAKAWEQLFGLINEGLFSFDKATALTLHAIAGQEEALEWGVFRQGFVSIAGSSYEPPAADRLDRLWKTVEEAVSCEGDIYDAAMSAFLLMARHQFFWDVNKRMGRFMMNGLLLNAGFPIINVPAKRQLEFNQGMLDYYDSGDQTAMRAFLRSCLHPKIIQNFQQPVTN